MQSSKKSQRKSIHASSTYKSVKDDVQDNIEFMKISIKKESDRKYKLKHLHDKYSTICNAEKKHVKQIKSALIELKDAPPTPKIKMLPDPSIFVDNSLKVETRQFFCALLNTFYTAYSENQKNNDKVEKLNSLMSFLIKGISFDEDKILLLQKSQINEQVQLEGQLLAQKNRLKEELTKKRQVDEAFSIVEQRFKEQDQKHQIQVDKVKKLQRQLQQMKEQSKALRNKIEEKQKLRKDCQDKVAQQLRVQKKLEKQVNQAGSTLKNEQNNHKNLLKKLCSQKINNISLKSHILASQQMRQNVKFNTTMELKKLR